MPRVGAFWKHPCTRGSNDRSRCLLRVPPSRPRAPAPATTMTSLTGKLLVASSDLEDANFKQAVVLVIDHDDQGAFGLVLNRPSTVMLKSAWEQWTHEPCAIDSPLLVGGPVQGPLSALHSDPTRSEREVVSGVFITRDRDLLVALVAAETRPLRVFVGYSGWGPGQLENELDTGSWSITPATSGVVFGDDSTVWLRMTRHIADERLRGWLGVRHATPRPEDN